MNRYMKKVHEGWEPPPTAPYVPYETKVTLGPYRRIVKAERTNVSTVYRLTCAHEATSYQRVESNKRFATCGMCAHLLWRKSALTGHRGGYWNVAFPEWWPTVQTLS